MVTLRHVFKMWVKGWTIAQLTAEYKRPAEWVEKALRKYYGKSR